MRSTIIKVSTFYTLAFLIIVSGCVSVRKEGKSFIVEIKSKSQAPSILNPENVRGGQPVALTAAPEHVINKITLSWTAPTANSDDTPLRDLDGYKVYYGLTEDSLGDEKRNQIDVSKNDTSVVIYNLASGQWCFEVKASDTSGNDSEYSDGECIHIRD